MNIGVEGLFQFLQEQGKYILYMIIIVVAIVCAAKRAWVLMITSIIGISIVGIFVLNPQLIGSFSGWFADKLNIG